MFYFTYLLNFLQGWKSFRNIYTQMNNDRTSVDFGWVVVLFDFLVLVGLVFFSIMAAESTGVGFKQLNII